MRDAFCTMTAPETKCLRGTSWESLAPAARCYSWIPPQVYPRRNFFSSFSQQNCGSLRDLVGGGRPAVIYKFAHSIRLPTDSRQHLNSLLHSQFANMGPA